MTLKTLIDPKFSVIIPTYNCAVFVMKAVASVQAQSYRDFEIIVVDDGSTDNTRAMLDGYISRGEVRYFFQDNAGPGTARNNGIKKASGEFITFLDSDDLFHEEYLETVADYLRSNSDVDFVFTNYDIFDESGVVNNSGVDTWKVFRTLPHRSVGEDQWVFSVSLCKYIIEFGGFMSTSGTTIRRAILEKYGLFKEGYFYGEDDELYARASYRAISGYIDRVLSRVRNHSGSLIHNHNQVKGLRNVAHYLELTEHQLEYYRRDKELSDLLRRKVARLAHDYCWGLQVAGRLDDAHNLLLGYLPRFRSFALAKLLVKNYLIRMGVLASHD